MTRTFRRSATVFGCVCCLLATGSSLAHSAEPASDTAAAMSWEEGWTTIFSDQPAKFHVRLHPSAAREVRVAWTLAVEGRTVSQGEVAATAPPGQPARVELPVALPPLREGVAFQATLRAEMGGGQYVLVKRLWLLPRDPFAERRRWLESLHIALFDPVGATAKAFESLRIPFRRIWNAAELPSLSEGILIVGEGTSLRQNRTLAPTLVQLSAAGVAVICLAPADGEFDVLRNEKGSKASSIRLAGREAITELDKRLDATAWPPDGAAISSRLVPAKGEAGIVLRVAPAAEDTDSKGWPYLRVDPVPRGRLLIVCGFPLIKQWDAGPSPRYLLAAILGRLETDRTDRTNQRANSVQE